GWRGAPRGRGYHRACGPVQRAAGSGRGRGAAAARRGTVSPMAAAIERPESLRVLTLNIWNRQGPWEQRVRLIRDGLVALAPDVVSLQEVMRHDALAADQAHEIAAGLGYHVAFGPGWHIGDGLHLGNAVLSRWAVIASHHMILPGNTVELDSD